MTLIDPQQHTGMPANRAVIYLYGHCRVVIVRRETGRTPVYLQMQATYLHVTIGAAFAAALLCPALIGPVQLKVLQIQND